MKRLLSLILALALVAGMIPAVFATETENVIWSPKYLFNSSTGLTTFTVGSKVTAGDSAMWEVVGMPGLNSSTALNGNEMTFSVATATGWNPDNDNALVLSLSVDKTGRYASELIFREDQAYTGLIDCYIVHKDVVTEKNWDVTQTGFLSDMISEAKRDDLTADVQYIASCDINKNSGEGKTYWKSSDVALKAGENYLFFVINIPKAQGSGNRAFGLIKSYELTCKGTITTSVDTTELRVGGSTPISAVVTDGIGTVVDTDVTYTSSDETVAKVEGGVIKAVGEGTATITAIAAVNGVTVSDNVKITSKLVKGTITATASKTALKLGETATITATAKDADGNSSNAVLSYKSSDEKVATVDASGKVTPVGEGEATITVSAAIDGILVENQDVKISVSVVWDPVYSFIRSAFKVAWDGWDISGATDMSNLVELVSTGKWQYYAGMKKDVNNYNINISSSAIDANNVIFYTGQTTANAYDNALVLKANLESTGVYKPTVNFRRYNYCGTLDIYFVPKAYAEKKNWDLTNLSGTRAVVDDAKLLGTQIGKIPTIDMHTEAGTSTSFTAEEGFYLPEGEHYIVMSIGTGVGENTTHPDKRRYGSLTNITLTRQPTVETTVSKTTLAVGDSATLTSGVTSGENQDITATTEVTYTSSDRNVVQVSGNKITAVGEGTATITATAANGATDTVEIKVEAKKISLAYTTSVDEENIVVEAHKAGSVTVNAPEKTGYTFSHWVRGTAASGVWVSADASYTFDLVSPTYLTAIYVDEDAKIVEFFNGNSELLAQETVKADGTVETPVNPTMVGFKFLRWITAKDIEFVNSGITAPLTRVVAEFEDDTATYNVADQTDVKYDTAITKTSDNEVAWKRGDVVVGYGTSYTYNVWADVESITSEAISEKKPLVYIDPTIKTVGTEKACMIEFDGAGKEIVEVGILFSNSGTPEVGSCQYKATSKTNGGDDGHGQFTAKPANNTQTVARGYLIYNENGEYKTEYSEVLSLNN